MEDGEDGRNRGGERIRQSAWGRNRLTDDGVKKRGIKQKEVKRANLSL